MLDLFRRRKSGLKWTLWIVIFALSGGMVLLFVDVPTGVGGTLGNRDVAVVAGNRITVAEYRRAYGRLYEAYRQNYRLDSPDPAILKQLGLPQQVLDGLINRYAVNHEASRLGIEASPQEVAEYIATDPIFQEDGIFIGAERYKQILQANNFSISEYEGSVRMDILGQKLRSVLTDGIMPTLEETRQEFVNRNQKIKLRYLTIDPKEVEPKQVTEEDLQAYFEEHGNEYQVAEQRRLKYVKVSVEAGELELREDDIRIRMATLNESERVRASHILISTENREDTEARETASEILSQVREGTDFAELAKKHSDDPGSGTRGGDLGFFQRGQMVPEFERTAFSLEPDEISDLVKTQFGYHIIKVTEAPKIDRRKVAEEQLREEEAKAQALNVATKMIYQVREGARLYDITQQHGLEMKETTFFSLGDVVPGLQVRSDFNQQVFTLSAGQVIERPYESGNTYLVAELLETQPAQPMTLEEARGRVTNDFKSTRGEEIARERAFALSVSAGQEKSLTKAARVQGLKTTSTDFFKQGDSIDETLGSARAVHERAFHMEPGEISPAILLSDRYVVFELAEKSPVDEKVFEQDKKQIREELTGRQRTEFYQAWLKSLISRLYEEEQIQVNRKVVDAASS